MDFGNDINAPANSTPEPREEEDFADDENGEEEDFAESSEDEKIEVRMGSPNSPLLEFYGGFMKHTVNQESITDAQNEKEVIELIRKGLRASGYRWRDLNVGFRGYLPSGERITDKAFSITEMLEGGVLTDAEELSIFPLPPSPL